MARHDNVSCDACFKNDFKGLRFKCLHCFDYDLCSECYDREDISENDICHSSKHPMQCLIADDDFDLYFGGEVTNGKIQSFTCPICCACGWSEQGLVNHVADNHKEDSWVDIICPICLSSCDCESIGLITFANHLQTEHSDQNRKSLLVEGFSRVDVRKVVPALYRSPRSQRNIRSLLTSRTTDRSVTSESSMEMVDSITHIVSQLRARKNNSVLPPELLIARKDLKTPMPSPVLLPDFLQPLATSKALDKPDVHKVSQKFVCTITEPNVPEEQLEKLDRDKADRSLFVEELFISMLCQNNFSGLMNWKSPDSSCYKRVMDETTQMQNKIQEELKLDPVDKEVVVLYEGEKADTSNQFWQGKRIVEMVKKRPSWFSKNLLQKTTESSDVVPNSKPKDLA